jgi:hypothetical protein
MSWIHDGALFQIQARAGRWGPEVIAVTSATGHGDTSLGNLRLQLQAHRATAAFGAAQPANTTTRPIKRKHPLPRCDAGLGNAQAPLGLFQSRLAWLG